MSDKHKLYIENVVVFANYIYVDGWCGRGEEGLVISVTSGSDGEPRTLPGLAIGKVARPDVAKALKLENDESAPVGFVFKTPVGAVADLQPTKAVLKWVAAKDGLSAQIMAKAKTIGALGGQVNRPASDTVRRAISCNLVDSAVAAFFLAFDNGHRLPSLKGDVDDAMRAGHLLAVDLWIENAGARNLVALTEDGASASSQIIVSSRPDVTQALLAQGETVVTHAHGIFLLFKFTLTKTKRVLVGVIQEGEIQAVFSAAVTASADGRERLVARLAGMLGNGGLPRPAIAEEVFRRLIEQTRAEPLAKASLVICAASQPPKMSIIVPLFKIFTSSDRY